MTVPRTPPSMPPRTVFLVGFMGSGKTTVGKLLAQRMAWKFVDLDLLIEQAEGMSIAEIFARAGEAAFRKREQELLRRILDEDERAGGRVVALGGGTVAQPENFALLQHAQAITIWLECPIEQLLMRCALMVNRPLFRDEASFRKLYEERLPFYQKSTFTVHSGPGDPLAVVQQILALPIFQNAPCLTESEP
ncbi:MAG TPA: shikimate kinase [Terriglobia bacterium]|nr:shikimate kinase [Terriglobia bacterium]